MKLIGFGCRFDEGGGENSIFSVAKGKKLRVTRRNNLLGLLLRVIPLRLFYQFPSDFI